MASLPQSRALHLGNLVIKSFLIPQIGLPAKSLAEAASRLICTSSGFLKVWIFVRPGSRDLKITINFVWCMLRLNHLNGKPNKTNIGYKLMVFPSQKTHLKRMKSSKLLLVKNIIILIPMVLVCRLFNAAVFATRRWWTAFEANAVQAQTHRTTAANN